MPDFKIFKIDDNEHEIGNKECSGCWSSSEAPRCDVEGCSGLMHNEFLDEDWDNVYLTWKCDVCDNTDSPSDL